MQTIFSLRRMQAVLAAGLAAGAVAMTGCGVTAPGSSSAGPVQGAAIQGHVFGGQQPVSGSTIQLYAANQTGYGQNATALLTSTVTTDTNGNFSITGLYTCPFANSLVYLTATGGTASTGAGANANLAEMAVLGPCGNLSSSTFISMNELTTVAATYALSGFMSSITQVATSPTNVTGLTNAFSTALKLVDTSTGQMPGPNLAVGAVEPVAELNTLADVLAACVNTGGGTANDGSACGKLFGAATVGSSVPTDTVQAMLNIAKNPANNASAVFNVMSSTPPFQPTLTSAPNAYTVALQYQSPTAFRTPSAAAMDAAGNLWVTNTGDNSMVRVDATTAAAYKLLPGFNAPSGIAFDNNGNGWVTSKGNNSLFSFSPTAYTTVSASPVLTTNLNAPTGVAVDGSGTIWVTNAGNNSVTQVTASALSVTGSTVYSTGGSTPIGVAVSPQ